MTNATEPLPWYRDGLAFACTRCGNCCTGAPGFVWVNVEEMERLAQTLALSFDEFTARFVRQVGTSYSLIEKPNHECVFWDSSRGCTVYDARPVQCRTWPFWPAKLASPQDWAVTQTFCPGTRGGPVHSLEEIEAQARRAAQALGA
jgi:Fe-S-cluster containining protein